MTDGSDGRITLERLRVLLDSYGAAAGRWPAQERAAALALIETSDTARAAYREAARLDELLDRMPEAELSPALARRMVALPLPPPLHWPEPGWSPGWAAPGHRRRGSCGRARWRPPRSSASSPA